MKAGSAMPPDKGKRRRKFPWLPLLLLLGTIYIFWVLPLQLGPRPPKVEFSNDK